jgi:hypothetical protein
MGEDFDNCLDELGSPASWIGEFVARCCHDRHCRIGIAIHCRNTRHKPKIWCRPWGCAVVTGAAPLQGKGALDHAKGRHPAG